MMKYAIYARVSTAMEEQQTSYETQTKDLKAKIKILFPDYRLYKVYGDLGISGTKENRPSFQEMLQDAKAKKFDLIITKSISRFARNTRLLLNSINELEETGVHIYFLEENINTGSPQQKFLLTVLGALAQMESENLRAHIKEGFAIKRAAGKPARPFITCFGYTRKDDETVINEEEAKVVRTIFQLFVEDGLSFIAIAKKLRTMGYKTSTGKTDWKRTSVQFIVTNRKYVGEIIELGQTFENAIPAIVSREQFEAAQKIVAERSKKSTMPKTDRNFKASLYPLSGICTCSKCGNKLTRYISHKERKATGDLLDPCVGTPIWGCYNALEEPCHGYRISEQYMYQMIIEAICHEVKQVKSGVTLLLTSLYMEDSFKEDDYDRLYEAYQVQKKDLEKQRKKELDLYTHDMITLEEAQNRVKRIDKELALLQPPKTDEKAQINRDHLNAFFEAIKSKGDAKAHLHELFKDTEIKRSIVRTFIDHIVIGDEPKYQAKIYFKKDLFKDEFVTCQVRRRGPYTKYGKAYYDEVTIL